MKRKATTGVAPKDDRCGVVFGREGLAITDVMTGGRTRRSSPTIISGRPSPTQESKSQPEASQVSQGAAQDSANECEDSASEKDQ